MKVMNNFESYEIKSYKLKETVSQLLFLQPTLVTHATTSHPKPPTGLLWQYLEASYAFGLGNKNNLQIVWE